MREFDAVVAAVDVRAARATPRPTPTPHHGRVKNLTLTLTLALALALALTLTRCRQNSDPNPNQVPGIKKLLPESFRKHTMFDNIYNLECVPIATVQVRGRSRRGIGEI